MLGHKKISSARAEKLGSNAMSPMTQKRAKCFVLSDPSFSADEDRIYRNVRRMILWHATVKRCWQKANYNLIFFSLLLSILTHKFEKELDKLLGKQTKKHEAYFLYVECFCSEV